MPLVRHRAVYPFVPLARRSFAVALVCVILSSCAPKHRIEVELRDGSTTEYSLVSIRDSAIVVLPTYEQTDPRYLAYTHMQVIADTAINRVKLPVQGDFVSSIPAMLIGAGIGATVGKPCDCEDKLSKSVIGLALAWNLEKVRLLIESLTNDWLYLWVPDDRQKVRGNAIFHDEPPIMEYVK
ncbi:MAG: hypothetical protein JSS75_09355 [Bacteroidetes bacterium]|nr:hypothetical protein [Bacteroidota bacterium]